MLVGISPNGALWCRSLKSGFPPEEENELLDGLRQCDGPENSRSVTVYWETDVKALQHQALVEDTVNEKAMTRFREIDCRWAWLGSIALGEACQAE